MVLERGVEGIRRFPGRSSPGGRRGRGGAHAFIEFLRTGRGGGARRARRNFRGRTTTRPRGWGAGGGAVRYADAALAQVFAVEGGVVFQGLDFHARREWPNLCWHGRKNALLLLARMQGGLLVIGQAEGKAIKTGEVAFHQFFEILATRCGTWRAVAGRLADAGTCRGKVRGKRGRFSPNSMAAAWQFFCVPGGWFWFVGRIVREVEWGDAYPTALA